MVGTKMPVVSCNLCSNTSIACRWPATRQGQTGYKFYPALLCCSAPPWLALQWYDAQVSKEREKELEEEKRPSFPSIHHVENRAGNCWTNLSQTELRRLGHLVVTLTLAARKP